jgi:hypothetical protein
MSGSFDVVGPSSATEFRVRAAQARAAANFSDAEFTRRLRDYGLDFRQENVARIESGVQPMTLEEALVIGEVLHIEVPTSAGAIRVELASASFARDLDRAQKEWRRLVERLVSLHQATDDFVQSSAGIRAGYAADLKAAEGTGDQKLLSLAQSLFEKALATKQALDVLHGELDDPDWPA